MAYVEYKDLETPTQVFLKMVEFIKSRGYNVIQDVVDDLNIYDMSSTDGKRFCFKNKTEEYFIILRTAEGNQIFGTDNDGSMTSATIQSNSNFYGIGMTVSEGYSAEKRWYNQFRVPVSLQEGKSGINGKDVQGAFLPVPVENFNNYTLYCNNVSAPNDLLTFTIVKQNSINNYFQCAHLVYADILKYDNWEGGALFSGSANRYMMTTAYRCFDEEEQSDRWLMPILGSSDQSNTFLRIDIDDAVSEPRGNIRWASSGLDKVTGKYLVSPIRDVRKNNDQWKIPNYRYLQSTNPLDWGRNICTLNGITLNMPIFLAVNTDPDQLGNYAPVGDVPGAYYVSTLNMQTGGTYEISYPASQDLCQVFPFGKRRGYYGFDGISIRQKDTTV